MRVKNLFLGDICLLTNREYTGYSRTVISHYSLQKSTIFYRRNKNSEKAKDIKVGNWYYIKKPYYTEEGEKFVLEEKQSDFGYGNDKVSALDYSFIQNELDNIGYTKKHISKRKVLKLLGPSVDSVNACY